MRSITVLTFLFLLHAQSIVSAGGNSGKWIKMNPPVTSQTLTSIFFVNPALGWAGGRNGGIIHTEDSGNSWQVQSTPRNCWIRSIFFIDQNEGWAVGKYGFLQTHDGGGTWIERNEGVLSGRNANKIIFLNKRIGWMALYGQKVNLIYTDDGGATWSDKSSLINAPYLTDVVFHNDSLGFICGGTYLARTKDGGKTWTQTDSTPFKNIAPMGKFQMIDTSIGYCLGTFGIAKTTDGGQTWHEALYPASSEGFMDMFFSSPDTGFALFGYNPMYIFRTNDGGASWQNTPLTNIHATTIDRIFFPQKDKGIAVADNGAIYGVLSIGDSIFEITKGTGNEMNCIDFCDAKHGYAGTGFFYPRDSAILFTNDGGITWNKMPSPLTTIQKLVSFDSNTIIIYAQDSTPHCIVTRDDGRSWTPINDFNSLLGLGKISSIKNAGFAMSRIGGQSKISLYTTVDAGKTWTKKQDSLYATGPCFLNSDTAWGLNLTNVIFTSDGGTTWKNIASGYIPNNQNNSTITDFFFISSQTGWIVGYKPGSGLILRSDDGGKTWSEQKNISYFPDWYMGPEGLTHHEFIKVFACKDGKQAWVLDQWNGVLHTMDGGENWVQDTIPASPGMIFTDLKFNSFTNTLWLTSNNFGIWKYDIPVENAIKNTAQLEKSGTIGKIVQKNNELLLCSIPTADEIVVSIYSISGRVVFSKAFSKGRTENSLFVPMSALPSGHYMGEVLYKNGNKSILKNTFNINILK